MCKQRFHIIGLSDQRDQQFSREVLELMANHHVFSGGKRHHEIMRAYLPAHCTWIDIIVPISGVFAQYENQPEIVVFASGDPLFYGFAATVKRLLPDAEIKLYPYFNSIQMLAHRLVLPYQDMRFTSVTGRPWKGLDTALIQGEKLIGVLTDREKTPTQIAARLLEYGYSNYRMHIGESLGNVQEEKVTTLTLEEAAAQTFGLPNCVILEQTAVRERPFGIPEKDFHLLNGRVNMITKMPIRLLTLSMLDLQQRHTFWDVGSCTGSVSVEAKLHYPHLDITAFEIRPEGQELMEQNSRKFGAPGIQFLGGDFLEQDLSNLPSPDAVFIGGHGGKLKEMVAQIHQKMAPGGVLVFNSVSAQSLALFREGVAACGMTVVQQSRIAIDEHNPIEILKAQ